MVIPEKSASLMLADAHSEIVSCACDFTRFKTVRASDGFCAITFVGTIPDLVAAMTAEVAAMMGAKKDD